MQPHVGKRLLVVRQGIYGREGGARVKQGQFFSPAWGNSIEAQELAYIIARNIETPRLLPLMLGWARATEKALHKEGVSK